jgi:uncharacterized protein YfaS (alpha-2-macroglobulin family)
MRFLRVAPALMVLAVSAVGCHHGHFHVVSRTPEGENDNPVQSVVLTFDRPMVAEDAVGKSSSDGPLVLTPPSQGTYIWTDRQTLTFQPAQPLPRSTQYSASLDTDLKADDGTKIDQPETWQFATQRLDVTQLGPAAHLSLPLNPTFTLTFNQPVQASDVATKCNLTEGAAAVIPLKLTSADGAVTNATLVPTQTLTADTAYHLACDGSLHGTEGSLGMARGGWSGLVHTYGDLAVVSTRPNGDFIDVSGVTLEVTFSNPVKAADVAAHLVSSPTIPGLGGGTMDTDGTTYHVVVDLQPAQYYKMTVTSGLTDVYGQTLASDYTSWGKDYEPGFTTGDDSAKVYMLSGTYMVDAAWPKYSLWTRNVSNIAVSAARVTPDKIVSLLKDQPGSYYDEEDDEGGDGGAAPKTYGDELSGEGIDVKTQQVKVSGQKDKWQNGALSPSDLCGGAPTGVFAMSVNAPEVNMSERRVIVDVTNLGLVAKIGLSSGLVWATHLSDGQPAAGVKIDLRDAQNNVKFSGVTGADGTLATPGTVTLNQGLPDAGTGDDEEESSAPTALVIASEGDDVAVLSGSWTDGLEPWNFDIPYSWDSQPQSIRGFIQTDRGLYRPGETVHLKGLARQFQEGQGFRVPSESQADVVIKDAHGDQVLDQKVALSQFGGFHLDESLDADARLGDWTVTATMGSGSDVSTFSDTFTVEEYRPATFEVKVKPDKDVYQLGDKIAVDVDANYLFGAPLTGGQVQWSVQRRDHYPEFDGYDGYTWNDLNAMDDSGDWWARYGEQSYSTDLSDETADLDGSGHASLTFPSDASTMVKAPQDYMVQATVTDQANQAISQSAVVLAHRSPFYLGIHFPDYFATAGTPFTVDTVALDDNGKPVNANAELVVSLRNWLCPGYVSGVYQSCTEKDTEISRQKVALTGNGPSPVTVTPEDAGTLLVSLRAPDGQGNEVVASDELWVEGGGDAGWYGGSGNTFKIISSKQSYKPGDTAKLLAQTSLTGGTALLTLERNGIVSEQVVPFKSAGKAFEIPLDGTDAPNVIASIAVVRGRTAPATGTSIDAGNEASFAMGMVDLEVAAEDKKLKVKVATDKPSYKPGDNVTATVAVTDQNGSPVQAEVALAAADEGVLELIDYKTPDPQATFYAAMPLGVQTSTTFDRFATITDPEQDDTAYIGDSGEGGGGSSGHPRSKFESTAYWNPSLVTGEDGTAQVTFAAPDNLTAFRLMASAADSGDRFGSGDVRMTVAKPVAALPALPRFLTVGDVAQAGVVINNDTKAGGTATVSLQADGVLLVGTNQQQINLAAGGSKLVTFAINTPTHIGTATFTFSTQLGADSDSVKVSVPIERPVEQAAAVLGEGDITGPTTVTIAVPPNAVPDSGGLDVVADSTGLSSSGVDQGLRYLISYPYG